MSRLFCYWTLIKSHNSCEFSALSSPFIPLPCESIPSPQFFIFSYRQSALKKTPTWVYSFIPSHYYPQLNDQSNHSDYTNFWKILDGDFSYLYIKQSLFSSFIVFVLGVITFILLFGRDIKVLTVYICCIFVILLDLFIIFVGLCLRFFIYVA